MSGLELNKLAAAVLVAGLIAMVAGKVTTAIYHPAGTDEEAPRGYAIAVTEDTGDVPGVAEAEEAAPENILPLLASADAGAGEALAKRCVACHTFEKGGPHKVGPNLWSIVNASKGSKSGYAYSDAMAAAGGRWDYQSLSAFIKNPKQHVPGTKMVFAGLKKESDRAALIAYMRNLSDSPAPLP